MASRPPPGSLPARLYAWLGATAFAGSLGYFVYFYVRVLERPAAPAASALTSLGAIAIDLALFGVFAAHHSVMARTGAKRWLVARLPPALERATYVWAASILFFLVCRWWRPVPGDLYDHVGLAAWPHWLGQLLGLWLIAWSAAALDWQELAGIRQAVDPQASPSFRVVGPYRLVRHPLYLGWMLLVFGSARMTASRFAFACISTAYVLVAIPWEERSLRETLGERYRIYMERVRWRVVPFVY